MGYYSKFTIEIVENGKSIPWDNVPAEVLHEVLESVPYALTDDPVYIDHTSLTVAPTTNAGDGIKWYRWEQDMRELSADCPQFGFLVSRRGGDPFDNECALFSHGRRMESWGHKPARDEHSQEVDALPFGTVPVRLDMSGIEESTV